MRIKLNFSLESFFSEKVCIFVEQTTKHTIAMKKFIYLAMLCVAIFATSCSKYDIETTDLIGKWERSEIIHKDQRYWRRQCWRNRSKRPDGPGCCI